MGMGHVTTLLAAVLVGAAVWVGHRDGRGGLSRLRTPRVLFPWLRPRPDALPARTRAVLAGAAAVAMVLLSDGVGLWATAGLAVVIAGGGFVVLGLFSTVDHRAARDQLVLDLPEVLELLAAALSSGLPLRRAVRLVSDLSDTPVAVHLQEVQARIEVGMADADAWRTLADHPILGDTARDLARTVDQGTGVHELLLVRAVDARVEAVELRRRRARTVGVRSALPLTLCFLPAFVLVGIVPSVASTVLALWPG